MAETTVVDAEIVAEEAEEPSTELVQAPRVTALVPKKDEVAEWGYVKDLGKTLAASGMFKDGKDVAKYCVKILAGRELGIGPIAAVRGIYMTPGGAPSFMANLMAGIIKKSGQYKFRVTEHTDTVCKIEFFEWDKNAKSWESCGVPSVFTAAEAKKAGTKNMDKYPKNMLFARALANGARWYCADAFNGNTPYVPEEFGANVEYDKDGNAVGIIETTAVVNDTPIATQVITTTPTMATRRRVRQKPSEAEKKFDAQASLEAALKGLPPKDVETFLAAWDKESAQEFSDEDVTVALKQLKQRATVREMAASQ